MLPGSGTPVCCCLYSANDRSVGFDERFPKKSWYETPSPCDDVPQPHCGGKAKSGTTDSQYWVPAAAPKLTAAVYTKFGSPKLSFPMDVSPPFPAITNEAASPPG